MWPPTPDISGDGAMPLATSLVGGGQRPRGAAGMVLDTLTRKGKAVIPPASVTPSDSALRVSAALVAKGLTAGSSCDYSCYRVTTSGSVCRRGAQELLHDYLQALEAADIATLLKRCMVISALAGTGNLNQLKPTPTMTAAYKELEQEPE